MKAQFLSQLASKPWDLDKLRARSILAAIAAAVLRAERPDEDLFGDPLPKMQLLGPVALIPLTGILSINVPDWIKELGINLTDANDIAEELDQAIADANIEMIVFDVDSPGGLSLAGDKLFHAVEAANRQKPVFAFCGDGADMASAAYNSVAAATGLLAGQFAAGIGCIGSYLALLDDTGFWELMGIKIEVFRSGELKGIGEDALSQEQRDYLQSIVDQAGGSIRAHVQKYRTDIDPADLQGQWFEGTEAAHRGFVAGNARDLNAAIAKFQRLV